jgi:Collagen triple helix repeat (20 copies)
MISRIHSKLGTAGLVVAIVALVAALGGGAYAAQQGLNGKQKKEVKKIAKKFAGKPGPAGPQGPKGDTGAAGPAGKDGTNGTDGTDGDDGAPGAKGEAGMCSAEEPECSLAPGGVLTGVWSAAGGEDDLALASISFPVRVSPAPVAVYPFKLAGIYSLGYEVEDGKKTLVGPYPCISGCAGEGATEQEPEKTPVEGLEEAQAAYLEACPGTAAEPEATAGVLCIYVKDRQGVLADPVSTFTGSLSESAHEFGVTLAFEINAPDTYTRGSWAVAG